MYKRRNCGAITVFMLCGYVVPLTAQIGVYRPANSPLNPTSGGKWLLRDRVAAGNPDITFAYGGPGDIPVVGDWNGSGRDAIGVYRPAHSPLNPTNGGKWLLRNTVSPGNPDITFAYGGPGDIPVVGDWTGSGKTTIGVYRPPRSPLNPTNAGKWLLRNSNSAGNPNISFDYGGPGDIPVVGDWTESGKSTIGVYRPANSPLNPSSGGNWLLRNSNTAGTPNISFDYGGPEDLPVIGGWYGSYEKKSRIGVYRPANSQLNATTGSLWLLRENNTAGNPSVSLDYGGPGDIPVVWVQPRPPH